MPGKPKKNTIQEESRKQENSRKLSMFFCIICFTVVLGFVIIGGWLKTKQDIFF